MYVDDECSDPENFVPDCVEETEYEFDNFKNFEKRIQKFEQDLQIFEKDSNDSFFNAIFHPIYCTLFNNKDKFEFCQDNDKFLQVFGENVLNKLKLLKPELRLNLCLGTFESQCHITNDLLMEKNLFLRVYGFRKKFRYLIKKLPKRENSVRRDLLAFVEERLNSFQIIRQLNQYEPKKDFKPIDIVYKPISNLKQKINCYFSTSRRNAYRVNSEQESDQNRASTAEQCFACKKFFIERKSLVRHLKICGRIPGIIYKFENQNIQTFFDNTQFIGDLPFVIYFDFKTTSGQKIYNFEEDCLLYPVPYSFGVAFHPCLIWKKYLLCEVSTTHLNI